MSQSMQAFVSTVLLNSVPFCGHVTRSGNDLLHTSHVSPLQFRPRPLSVGQVRVGVLYSLAGAYKVCFASGDG